MKALSATTTWTVRVGCSTVIPAVFIRAIGTKEEWKDTAATGGRMVQPTKANIVITSSKVVDGMCIPTGEYTKANGATA